MTNTGRFALFALLAVMLCGSAVCQTTTGVQQGGTGAATAAAARANLGAAPASHSHGLSELTGIAGKSGTGTLLQTFGGGATADGECAKFDAAGNIISAGAPCGGASRSNYSLAFNMQSSVTLSHGLVTANVIVACFDGTNQQVEPNGVAVLDANNVVVTFASPQSGRCVVNGTGGGGGTETTSAANSGAGASVLKPGTNIVARTLRAGPNVTITEGADEITVSASGGGAGGVVSINSQTGSSQTLSAGGFIGVASTANVHTISVSNTQGSGTRLATVNAAPADGCASWSGGTLASTGIACGSGSGGGTAYAAGAGIQISNGVISAAMATVPSYFTSSGNLTFANFAGTGNCEEQNLTLSGAVPGDAIALGLPASLPAGIIQGAAWVSVPNTVTVRMCRLSGTNTVTGLPFRAWAHKIF